MATSNTMNGVKFTVQALANTVSTRAAHGVLFLVLDDSTVSQGLYRYAKLKKVIEKYDNDNKAIISTAFADYGIKNLIVAVGHNENGISGSLDTILSLLNKVNENGWLSVPQITTDEDKKKVADFVKAQRKDEDYPIKAVLYNYESDDDGIVNFTAADLGEIASNVYTAQVAAQLCTLGANESITNHIAKNTTNCDVKADNDDCVSKGQLFLYNNGKNIIYSRGVNSLQTISEDQAESLTKIRIVEVIDLVKSDMREIFEQSYLGKFGNSYKNRKTLINTLNSYLKTLSTDGYLSNDEISFAELDVEASKKYLEGQGINTDDMKDEEVLSQKFGSYVFTKVTLYCMDTIEDINIVLQYET
ncbi:phage tail sheath C-terminal domain-containing protein [uncultured Clostridium sp.]|uniref:phage tail sheath C-terminal domain-containing protein n=1 Tax=uncultured Clostridium sp. TaxID=59620 RepID=UPI0028E35B94|nr:phage tail sheath C-terminal domain-containing protein [uncultured Clostridium sp.]